MKRITALILILILTLVCTSCTKINDLSGVKKLVNNKINEINSEKIKSEDIINGEYNYEFIENNYPKYKENIKKSFSDNADKYVDVLKTINGYRKEAGISVLTFNEDLCVIASIRAQEIAENKKYEHNRPNNKGYFSTLFNEYGYKEGQAAENIAWEFNTADEACEAWKNSASHYENLMNKQYTKTGIGIALTDEGKLVYVQEFMN